MKKPCILLALILLLACAAGCAKKDPSAATDKADAPASAAPAASEAEYLPDFTVKTVDGGTFTLSEALGRHELVLINIFATRCPPCREEFPYLQEAWAQNKDRVGLIAISGDPDDTEDMLRDFANEYGITFPVGREAGTDLCRFIEKSGYPTTLVVDRSGRILSAEGAKQSTQEFLDLFDGYTGESYDPDVNTVYTIYAFDAEYESIEGVAFTFCTDTACIPVTTNADGVAVFTGPAAKYHVEIVSAPDGFKADESSAYYLGGDFYTEPFGQVFYLQFTRDGR